MTDRDAINLLQRRLAADVVSHLRAELVGALSPDAERAVLAAVGAAVEELGREIDHEAALRAEADARAAAASQTTNPGENDGEVPTAANR
jgi:hypothetical protein